MTEMFIGTIISQKMMMNFSNILKLLQKISRKKSQTTHSQK